MRRWGADPGGSLVSQAGSGAVGASKASILPKLGQFSACMPASAELSAEDSGTSRQVKKR